MMSDQQEVQGPTFQYLVRVERTVKGARWSVHCYAKELETSINEAVKAYDEVGKRLEEKGLSVAPVEKAGKSD